MIFWRNKKNLKEQEQEKKEDRLLHRENDPALEPPTEYDPEMDPALKQDIEYSSEDDIIESMEETPVPRHTPESDYEEARDLSDHSAEGGWFSRLTSSLSKSTGKMTRGLSDLVTKKKLDQETLDDLEEVLLAADLGPQTAAHIIGEFSKDRFGKDISEQEIREALADCMEEILAPVAQDLDMQNAGTKPFVVLVCGVNGAGKTTTIGKYAHFLQNKRRNKVTIAAGDTFRAAAIEQLEEWAKRAGADFIARDIGADAAAVAFEAYEKAKADNSDVLLIDTAGRLHNKANLMAELQKIRNVLHKKDENLPHATLLVLDATTGQNAFAQVETFQEAVDISGLIVTKLDGSAKGGVLVGLAHKFGLPVYAIGIGESADDLQPFKARHYARSLMGLDVEEKPQQDGQYE